MIQKTEACNIIWQQDNQLSPVVRSAVAGHQKQDEGLRSHILRKRGGECDKVHLIERGD